jgi:hypothetical protein
MGFLVALRPVLTVFSPDEDVAILSKIVASAVVVTAIVALSGDDDQFAIVPAPTQPSIAQETSYITLGQVTWW